MLQLCRHIFPAGRACQAPAIHGTYFCRHHGQVKVAIARAAQPTPYGTYRPLTFAYPEDHDAIQLNLFVVLQALNDRKIDNPTANTMNRLLRSCELNLNKKLATETAAKNATKNTVQRVILTPEGDEIAPPREALEDGEAAPLHHKACPCQQCAEQYRNAAPEQHHADCQCGLCEVGDQETATENGCPISQRDVGENGDVGENAVRVAPAQKLYAQHLTVDPANKEVDVYTYLYGDHLKKYEAQYAARARAAIEAGIEPPPYEPFATNKVELECLKQEKIRNEQIEKNKQIAEEAWQRYVAREAAAGRTVEDKPLPKPWHEQEAIRREQWKKLREQQVASEALH
jgi:hypothetical protein